MQNLYRLANVMGLDASSPQHTVALKEAMLNIVDQNDFIEYCRLHKDGVEYATKVEKLDTLAVRYKKIEAHKSLPHDTANSFVNTLISKLNAIKTFVKNKLEIGGFEWDSFRENKPFTKKELKAIKGLNKSPNQIIHMIESGTIKEALIDLFMREYTVKSKYKSIGKEERKVLSMATHGARRMA